MKAPIEVTEKLLRRWPLPDPHATQGKDDRGRVVIVGGSLSVPGAVILAGVAALRAGAGKLQIAAPQAAAIGMGLAVPESKVLGIPTGADGELSAGVPDLVKAVKEADAVLIGPGMAATSQTSRFIAEITAGRTGTLVLDAGAIDAVKDQKGSSPVIATPNAGEVARLRQSDLEEVNANAQAIACDLACEMSCVIVLKGATTYIAHPDQRVWIHKGGGPGLGTSGSGDVLAGVITGLCARGAAPEQAAVMGVWLHAQAGDQVVQRSGTIGFLARELSEEIPRLMQDLQPTNFAE